MLACVLACLHACLFVCLLVSLRFFGVLFELVPSAHRPFLAASRVFCGQKIRRVTEALPGRLFAGLGVSSYPTATILSGGAGGGGGVIGGGGFYWSCRFEVTTSNRVLQEGPGRGEIASFNFNPEGDSLDKYRNQR